MVAGFHPPRPAGALLDGRFRILRALTFGPGSEVFEAEGPAGELRAIKILGPGHPDPDAAVRRFLREGCVLAALDHPQLVKVYDVGISRDGRPYFVMERLVGETLDQRIDRIGQLPAGQAASLLIGALHGLDAAHKAGVIHRDLKPSNIFLARDDASGVGERAMVLDFGIAKVRGSASDATAEDYIVGTPSYMAPEQILAGPLDARTDVYSMGLVLYYAIAGRGPFEATSVRACIRAHIHDEPLPIRRFADVPRPIEEAIEQAIQKAPGDRWSSAAVFAAALSRAPARPRARAPAPKGAIPNDRRARRPFVRRIRDNTTG